jgi:DNA modification methylase
MRTIEVGSNTADLYYGDGPSLEVLKSIPKNSIHCVVTSPPYFGLRNYDADGQIGLEPTPEEYIQRLVETFDAVRDALHHQGTVWVNLGDSYWGSMGGSFKSSESMGAYQDRMTEEGNTLAIRSPTPYSQTRARESGGYKPKDLIGIPWMFAFAMRARGWYLRTDIIWDCPNKMPESCKDRPGRAHEYIFLFTKSRDYFYDDEAVRVPSVTAFKPNQQQTPNAKSASVQQPRNTIQKRGGRTYPFRTGTRRLRSVWSLSLEPYKGAHTAPYPTKLVDPCVKAGSSEGGCCGACLSPLKRTLEKVRIRDKETDRSWQGLPSTTPPQRSVPYEPKKQGSMEPEWDYKTVGWERTCKCEGTEVIPCTVMDPFSGSGTTGLVATSLGRNYLGIDINGDYLPLAIERIQKKSPIKSDPDPVINNSDDIFSLIS